MNNFKNLFLHINHSWKHHPIIQLSAFLVLSGSYTVIFSMSLFFSNLENILVGWGSAVEMNIYLEEGVSDAEVFKVKNGLESLRYFENVRYIDSREAGANFIKKMSSYVPDFADQKDFVSVIPASFLGLLKKDFQASQLEAVAKKITKIENVEDVSYGKEWLQSFSSLLSSTKSVGFAVSAILILGAFFVVSFTVYAVIVRRKDEIEIMKLLGATPGMIQTPFLFEAGMLSAMAAGLALLLSYGFLILQNKFFISDMSYIGFSDYFGFYDIATSLIIIFVSFLVGMTFSYICLQKVDRSMRYQEDTSA